MGDSEDKIVHSMRTVALLMERVTTVIQLDVREATILRTEHHTVWQCHETNWCLERDRKRH